MTTNNTVNKCRVTAEYLQKVLYAGVTVKNNILITEVNENIMSASATQGGHNYCTKNSYSAAKKFKHIYLILWERHW